MIFLMLVLVTLSFGLNLERAIETALEKNPQLKALKEQRMAFEGMERSAMAFPNPEIRFESGFITNDKNGKPAGRAVYLLEYSQPVPLWDIRLKGKKVVEEEKTAFDHMIESFRRKLVAEVYRNFYTALVKKETVRIWRENFKTASEVEDFVKRAYKLGEATELELLRAKREKDMAILQLRIAESLYQASLRDLERLLNVDVKDPEGDLSKIPSLKDIEPEKTPTVAFIKKRIEAVKRQIELEKALAKPSLSAGFVVEDSEEGFYGLRVALSTRFPLFYRRQGEILQEIARRESLSKELEGELLNIKTKISSIKIRLEILSKELEKLESKIIPRAEEELKLALRSYRLRVITLLELSDIRRRYYDLLLRRAELYGMLHKVYSEFIEIGGWR